MGRLWQGRGRCRGAGRGPPPPTPYQAPRSIGLSLDVSHGGVSVPHGDPKGRDRDADDCVASGQGEAGGGPCRETQATGRTKQPLQGGRVSWPGSCIPVSLITVALTLRHPEPRAVSLPAAGCGVLPGKPLCPHPDFSGTSALGSLEAEFPGPPPKQDANLPRWGLLRPVLTQGKGARPFPLCTGSGRSHHLPQHLLSAQPRGAWRAPQLGRWKTPCEPLATRLRPGPRPGKCLLRPAPKGVQEG